MDSTFEAVSERILNSHRDFYPDRASSLGRHQYHGRPSDLSYGSIRFRDEYKRMKGAGFSLRESHDLALSYGEPPIPFLRAHILGDELRDPFQSVRC
jgi:hypothetical protein